MRYSIDINGKPDCTVQYLKPEETTMEQDLLAVGMFMKCAYDSQNDDEKELFIRCIESFVKNGLKKEKKTVKS